jgi:hypothetical protein
LNPAKAPRRREKMKDNEIEEIKGDSVLKRERFWRGYTG